MTAASFFAPGVPIPITALEAAGAALGVRHPATAVTRLIGLGLLDDFGEIGAYRHAALDPLARPLAAGVDSADEPALASAALPHLAEAWLEDGDFPPDPRGLEAARIALAGGGDPEVIEAAVIAAAAWLERRQGQTKAAFDLLAEARDRLPGDHAFRPDLLRLALECTQTAAFRGWALAAPLRPCSEAHPLSQWPYAAFDLRRAEHLLSDGDPATAEDLARNAMILFRTMDDERMVAMAAGQIADVLQARGDLDEALRIRREEQLPVFERLGDQRSRAVTMGKIADVLQARGDLDEALRIRREEQLPVYERLGARREKAVTLQRIATALLDSNGIEKGRIQEIFDAFAEAFAIVIELSLPDGIGAVGVQLAQILALCGLKAEACTVLDQAEAAFRKLGQQDSLAFVAQLREEIGRSDAS